MSFQSVKGSNSASRSLATAANVGYVTECSPSGRIMSCTIASESVKEGRKTGSGFVEAWHQHDQIAGFSAVVELLDNQRFPGQRAGAGGAGQDKYKGGVGHTG